MKAKTRALNFTAGSFFPASRYISSSKIISAHRKNLLEVVNYIYPASEYFEGCLNWFYKHVKEILKPVSKVFIDGKKIKHNNPSRKASSHIKQANNFKNEINSSPYALSFKVTVLDLSQRDSSEEGYRTSATFKVLWNLCVMRVNNQAVKAGNQEINICNKKIEAGNRECEVYNQRHNRNKQRLKVCN